MKSQQSASEASSPGNENPVPAPERRVGDPMETPFPEFIHQYLGDHVELADQKAGFVFAAVSAVLAYLVTKDVLSPLKTWLTTRTPLKGGDCLVLAAVLVLWFSAMFSIWVIAPRLGGKRTGNGGFIFWKDICAFSNSGAYSLELEKLTPADASSQIRQHCYVLAKICDQKYRRLTWAIWTGAVGFVLTLLWFLFS